MLKHKIDSVLKFWKENHVNEYLLANGARQVVKTFSIRQFGKDYQSFISWQLSFELRQL